jgi:hypothetical protein
VLEIVVEGFDGGEWDKDDGHQRGKPEGIDRRLEPRKMGIEKAEDDNLVANQKKKGADSRKQRLILIGKLAQDSENTPDAKIKENKTYQYQYEDIKPIKRDCDEVGFSNL